MRILIAATLAVLAPYSLAEAQPYVPRTAWRDHDEWAFYERWFSRQLRAMDERSFTAGGARQGFRERFRLLVIPTFTPAQAYRIDTGLDGTSTLRAVTLDGAGGYDPGRIAVDRQRRLRILEAQALRAAVRQAALPAKHQEDVTGQQTGDSAIVACADGTTYVFEIIERGRLTFVSRSCYLEPELERLVSTITGLSPANDARRRR